MNYFDYQTRKTRPQERIREDVAPESMPEDEPIEVKEDVLSQTGITKFWQRITARKP